jgi:hypothetical protein
MFQRMHGQGQKVVTVTFQIEPIYHTLCIVSIMAVQYVIDHLIGGIEIQIRFHSLHCFFFSEGYHNFISRNIVDPVDSKKCHLAPIFR